jgi:hypothetical protein
LAANAVFVPERRRLDGAVRDGLAPPSAVVAPIAQAVRALVEVVPSGAGAGAGPASVAADEPVAVVPGSLGAWPPSDL